MVGKLNIMGSENLARSTLLGIGGVTTLAGSARAGCSTIHTVKYKAQWPGESKLVITISWVACDGVICENYDVSANAGGIFHSFKEISYTSTEGGNGGDYFHVYAEAIFKDGGKEYTTHLGVTVNAAGGHSAYTNRRKKLVSYTKE